MGRLRLPTPVTEAGCAPICPASLTHASQSCADWLCRRREVALEEFEDYSNVSDSVHVRIANIPLQESLRDLRCAHGAPAAAGSPFGLCV